jgi:hypothetical protein
VGDLNTPFFFAVFDNPVDSGDNQVEERVKEKEKLLFLLFIFICIY